MCLSGWLRLSLVKAGCAILEKIREFRAVDEARCFRLESIRSESRSRRVVILQSSNFRVVSEIQDPRSSFASGSGGCGRRCSRWHRAAVDEYLLSLIWLPDRKIDGVGQVVADFPDARLKGDD
jgi:hypothetical protein